MAVRHDRHNAIPEEMRERLRVISNGRTIKETDSDWELGHGEQQYFYKKG